MFSEQGPASGASGFTANFLTVVIGAGPGSCYHKFDVMFEHTFIAAGQRRRAVQGALLANPRIYIHTYMSIYSANHYSLCLT